MIFGRVFGAAPLRAHWELKFKDQIDDLAIGAPHYKKWSKASSPLSYRRKGGENLTGVFEKSKGEEF